MVWDMWMDFGATEVVREWDFEVNVIEKAEVFFFGRIRRSYLSCPDCKVGLS